MMPRLRARALLRPLRITPLLVALTACAGVSIGANDARPDKATERMLSVGFTDIQDRYIEDLNARTLALAALEGLRKLDPGTEISSVSGQIVLTIDGVYVGSVDEPTGGDAAAWATATARVFAQAKTASSYLKGTRPETLYKAVFDAVLGKLDKFSRYAGREEARENRAARTGFGGIGVAIESHREGAKVIAVTTGMAADKAGILVGDRIVAIGEDSIAGQTLRKVVSLLRGPVGETARITVRRDGLNDMLKMTLKRAHIVTNTVFYEPRGESAYVRVTSFNRETEKRLRQALAQAQSEIGESIKGIILDVRNNPGGLLDQAVDVADLFLANGRIISTRGRHPKSEQRFDAKVEVFARGLPVAVLMNGTSASAAEILATALQDHGRAVVIGTTSFGKGTVQTVRRMPNEGELILTWARIYAPSGYALHRLGVLPTVCTSNVEDADSALEKSLNSGAHFTQRDHASRRAADITDENSVKIILSLCPWRPRKGKDVDLEVAERLLAQPALYRRALELARPAAGS